jgi:hypothetical protein
MGKSLPGYYYPGKANGFEIGANGYAVSHFFWFLSKLFIDYCIHFFFEYSSRRKTTLNTWAMVFLAMLVNTNRRKPWNAEPHMPN